MRYRLTASVLIGLLVVGLLMERSWSFSQAVANAAIADAAAKLVALTSGDQLKTMMLPADSPKRMGWHFIPKNERKGLQVRDMSDQQVKATHELLGAVLSEMGYQKTKEIMRLESLLHELEAGRGSNLRDPLRYYVTMFGQPAADAAWGLSIEGHHLSLNYWFDGNKITASTPQFFAANPGTVKNQNKSNFPVGTRVLAKEETLAFELVNSLSAEQLRKAVIAERAPREIRAAGEAQPPQTPAEGIAINQLNAKQKETLESLIDEYIAAMPEAVAKQRREELAPSMDEDVHFAWAGSRRPGIGHYYRVQSPTFLIEFVNTQPDAAGNPANHIHCVWRDVRGDFGVAIK